MIVDQNDFLKHLESLTSNNYDVREQAVETLIEIGPSVIPAVLELLLEDDFMTNYGVFAILEGLGKPAVDPLLEYLDHSQPSVRKNVIKILGEIRDEGIVPDLIELLNDSDLFVVGEVIDALGKIAHSDATLPLVQLLENLELREFVGEGLIEAIIELGENALPVLLEFEQHDSSLTRESIARILGSIRGSDSTNTLIRMLNDPDPEVRHDAINSLGFSNNIHAINPVLSMAKNASEIDFVRITAIHALGVFRTDEVLEFLLQMLNSPNEQFRIAAVTSLGTQGNPSAVPQLINVMNHSDGMLRLETVKALGTIGDKRPVHDLINLYSTADEELRPIILGAISQMGSPEAIPLLLHGLEDPDLRIKHVAINGLGRIGDARAAEALLGEMEKVDRRKDGSQHFFAIIQIGSPSIDVLVRRLLNVTEVDDPIFIQDVCQMIRAIDDDAAPRLVEILATVHPIAQSAIISKLGSPGDSEAIQHIVPFLKNAELKETAIDALKKLGYEFSQDE